MPNNGVPVTRRVENNKESQVLSSVLCSVSDFE